MRNVIVSARIKQNPGTNATPILWCEGACDGVTAHEFSHLELRYEYHPQDPPALNLIYRCDACSKARRWGCIKWESALQMDPGLTAGVLGLSEA